uniref:CSON003659 protein n=1 Tax=Culicoides sonorensis TaxID=179676 RepID=A0A336LVM0_CULSO
MIHFNIPAYKLRLDSALLECQYEMNGKSSNNNNNNGYNRNHHVYEQHFSSGLNNYDNNEQHDEGETLYSVKFYKDNEEFYRYMPKAKPPIHSYRVEGIKVDHQFSDSSRVMLRGLTLKSSGLYRCEISAEAPSFASVQAEGRMEVVYLPKDGPHISGEQQQQYQIGKSHPASVLQWYINDQPIK